MFSNFHFSKIFLTFSYSDILIKTDVQDFMFYRGFKWQGIQKTSKKKKKKR